LISWASIGGCFIIDSTISNELTSFIMMVIISVLVYFVISFWLMLESYEKELIIQKFVWIKQKIK
jgi:threonine/homoserine/homoserine lactone efflux protein